MHTPRPKGTVPPKWVIEKLRGTDRQSYILDHGFSDEQLSIKCQSIRMAPKGVMTD